MGHVGIDILALLLTDRLSKEKARSARAHLDQPCKRCRGDFELLSELRSSLADGELCDAPAELLHQARALFRDRVRQGLLGQKHGWLAELVYDSMKAPQLAGARGARSGRQLLYRVGGLDLDLHLAESGTEQRSLHGQLLGDDRNLPAGVVSLRVGARKAEASPDALGQFHFSKLPTRAFTLELRAGGRTVARIRLPGARRASRR